MGNSQSHVSSRKSGRHPNRLSKPPTNLTPNLARQATLNPKDVDRTHETPSRSYHQHPSLGTDSSLGLCEVSPGQDLSIKCDPESSPLQQGPNELRPEITAERQPSLSVRENVLGRRLSAPVAAIKSKRLSLDALGSPTDESVASTRKVDRRITLQDTSELATGLGLKLNGTLENQGEKRYSATRRQSLRTPGIATRVSEKPSPVAPSPKQSDNYNHHPYGEEPKDHLNNVSWLNLDSSPPDNGEEIPSIRASTPNNFEYSYLGLFKPGSLHVVNGRASPASSGRKSRSVTEAKGHSTYCGVTRDLCPQTRPQAEPNRQSSPLRPSYSRSITLPDVGRHTSFDEPSPYTNNTPNGGSPRGTCHPSSTSSRQISSNYPEANDQRDDAAAFFSPPKNTTPELMVTSKKTAAEDELFDEDEAVDISMPEIVVTTGDSHGFDDLHQVSTSTAPQRRSPQEYASRTSHGKANNLSKSDSGYSSTSSKGSSQPVCNYFCRSREGVWCSAPNCSAGVLQDGDTQKRSNYQSFGNPWPESSNIHANYRPIPADQSTSSSRGLRRPPSTELAYPNHVSGTENRQYSQHFDAEPRSCQTRPANCSSEWQQLSYQSQPWPLRTDSTAEAEPASNPTNPLENTEASIWTRSKASRRRSDRATLSKPLPFVQLEDLQQTPADRRPSSAGTPSGPSQGHDSSSGKYITRIKSLVSLRARRQQQQQQEQHEAMPEDYQNAARPPFPAEDGQPHQQDRPYERKPKRNKLKRKSMMFNYYVDAAA